MPKVNIGHSWGQPGELLSKLVEIDVDIVDQIDVDVAGTDKLVEIAFQLAFLQAFYVVADRDILIQTNNINQTAAGATISLQAGLPFAWSRASGLTCPLDDNVTKIYLTNLEPTSGPAAVTLRFARNNP